MAQHDMFEGRILRAYSANSSCQGTVQPGRCRVLKILTTCLKLCKNLRPATLHDIHNLEFKASERIAAARGSVFATSAPEWDARTKLCEPRVQDPTKRLLMPPGRWLRNREGSEANKRRQDQSGCISEACMFCSMSRFERYSPKAIRGTTVRRSGEKHSGKTKRLKPASGRLQLMVSRQLDLNATAKVPCPPKR